MIGLVAGDFGRIHEGHRDHIIKASQLVDYLIIVTHSDESIRQRKSYNPDPLDKRVNGLLRILNETKKSGGVILSLDEDGSVVKTLEYYHPDCFIKGGDRTPDNMPSAELDICQQLGIKVIYGVGELLNSSRKILKGERLENSSVHTST